MDLKGPSIRWALPASTRRRGFRFALSAACDQVAGRDDAPAWPWGGGPAAENPPTRHTLRARPIEVDRGDPFRDPHWSSAVDHRDYFLRVLPLEASRG